MRTPGTEPMGGESETVEVDETFVGNDRAVKPNGEKQDRGYANTDKALGLVDRKPGRDSSMVVDSLKATDLSPMLCENIAKESTVCNDEAGQHAPLSNEFAAHGVVRRGQGENGRGAIHTNTIEGFLGIFKHSMRGVFQHRAKRRLHRYRAEFGFRYNARTISDAERTESAQGGIVGKRLTYGGPCAFC